MIEWLAEPFQYAFMIRGFIAAILVGSISAVVGTFVVLRGMAFYGGALAHTILPGVAIGYLIGGGEKKYLFWWGMLAAVFSALGIGIIRQSTKIKEDTAIGIVFAGMFALGIAIISTVTNYSVDLTHFLFGDILGLTSSDLTRTALFSMGIFLFVLLFYKEFMVISFDPVLAVTLRLPAKLLDMLLMLLIAVTIVISLQTVGIALMVSMLVTPAATAYLLTKRLSIMMLLAAVFATISGVAGLYFSYFIGIASGAAIVLVTTLLFAMVWSFQQMKTKFSRISGR